MTSPEIVTREEWLEARKQFLVREKQATSERDALNADRRRLPGDPGRPVRPRLGRRPASAEHVDCVFDHAIV
jgi:hypothetical protein